MKVVLYVDSKGLTWAKHVNDNAQPEEYCYGITLGPEGLEELQLSQQQLAQLQAELVTRNLYNAACLLNKRHELINVLDSLALPHTLVREITGIFQRIYYA